MSGIVLNLEQQLTSYARTKRRNEQDAFLDEQQNVNVITSGHSITGLLVSFTKHSYNFGVHTAESGVTLSGPIGIGTRVFVNGIEIALIGLPSDKQISFQFTDKATADLVEKLIGAITFKDTDGSGFKENDTARIQLFDQGGRYALSEIYVGEAITGTDDDDIFTATGIGIEEGDELDGGAGEDILDLTGGSGFALHRMGKLTGIETIQGSDADDYVSIHGSQLSGLKLIDGKGGFNTLTLYGSYSDLSKTEILNFTEIRLYGDKARVADVDIAKLVHGDITTNELIIESGTLTAADRLALHRRGIEKITTIEDGQTTNYSPPQLTHFGGIVYAPSDKTVFIDRKQDAVLHMDAEGVRRLEVQILSSDGHDTLGVAGLDNPTLAGGLRLTKGLNAESKLVMSVTAIDGTVHTFTVGKVLYAGRSLGDNIVTLGFEFNESASITAVQQLIRSLTYKSSVDLQSDRTVVLRMYDTDGAETKTSVTFSADAVHANKLPTDIALSGISIAENSAAGAVIGTLSATDGDGDMLTYTLGDDAGGRFEIRNGELIVKAGAKLDFENATSHTITVKVSDGEASVAKDFVIHVGDVLETVHGATKGKNTLTGGIGMDLLNGGSGNDKLTGGAGADQFVFNSALGKGTTKANQNKKVNFDTITDFKRGEDKILLDNAIFKKLGKGSLSSPGALNKKFFKVGTKAGDKNDYLIYNKKTGILSYDLDGSGTKYKPVEFIKLSNKAALSAADFLII